MHELSIAMSLLDLAAEVSERHNGHVTAIHLRLGPLSGVTHEALVSAYELAREGTLMADAELVVEEVAMIAYCPACARDVTPVSIQELRCQTCGTPTPRIVCGRELEVVALEFAT